MVAAGGKLGEQSGQAGVPIGDVYARPPRDGTQMANPNEAPIIPPQITDSGAGVQNIRDMSISDARAAFDNRVPSAAQLAGEKVESESKARMKAERVKSFPAQVSAYRTVTQSVDAMNEAIAGAKDLVGWNTAGWGSALALLPATEAKDLQSQLIEIKAVVFKDVLQSMREASKTGGAVGNVSDKEGEKIESMFGAIKQDSSIEFTMKQLNRIQKRYENFQSNLDEKMGLEYSDTPQYQKWIKENQIQASSVPQQQQPPENLPQVGETRNGFTYQGGNPNDKNSWVAAQ